MTTPTATPTPAAPTAASVAGVWTLVTIDGAAVPVVLGRLGADTVEIVSDTLTLTANGTFTESGQARLTTGGRAQTDPFTEQGSFTVNGNTIDFVGNSGQRRSATLTSSTTLTVTVDGRTWAFRKS